MRLTTLSATAIMPRCVLERRYPIEKKAIAEDGR
jgi:hypothetical protein